MKGSNEELNEAFLKVLGEDYKDTSSEELEDLVRWCAQRVAEKKYPDTNTAWVNYEGYPDTVLFMITMLKIDVVELLDTLASQKAKEEDEAVKEHLDLMNDMRGIK